MSQFDLTAFQPVLKELIDNQIVQNTVYKDNPLYAMLTKNTNMGGKYTPQPIQIGIGQGTGGNFAAAQAAQTGSVFNEFLLTPAKQYSFSTIDRQTMLSAKTDKQSFVNALKNARDSALLGAKNWLGNGVFRSGTGSRGQIGSISTGVITLTNPSDATQFELNMTLQAAATDGATPRAAYGYIVAISRSAGTITVSATAGGSAGTPTSWAANDFLLMSGDSNAQIKGLAAWLPFADPSGGDNFFGVNRSVDRVRLAGVAYDGSSQSVEEGLQDGLNAVDLLGDGSTDYIMTSKNTLNALIKSQGSRVQYVNLQANAHIGFQGVQIQGPRGTVTVLSDRNCPAFTAYALQMDTWQLWSVGEAPALVEEDGLSMFRSATADTYEIRFAGYPQLGCNAPGKNGVFKVSA